MTASRSWLRQRWLALWRRIGATGDGKLIFAILTAHYSEPHRAYHNLAHIEACLREFDLVRSSTKTPDGVEIALWFHDAIYDPKANANEEQSAQLFCAAAKAALLPKAFIRRVHGLILATRHNSIPANWDARVMADVDLSILGKAPAKFSAYERQIRQEYAWVPKGVFSAGRATILKKFLARPAIYSTGFFCDRYEMRARKNMSRSLARLSGRREA